MSSLNLSLCTFNLLAPCYKRLSKKNDSLRENNNVLLMTKRINKSNTFYQNILTDIICLQEYYFNDLFQKIYTNELVNIYDIYTLQRTKNKQDGLAILILKQNPYLKILKQYNITMLNIPSNRICLAIKLYHEAIDQYFLISNIHLTFPHDHHDYKLRLKQIKYAIKRLENIIDENKEEMNIILAGDFNLATSISNDNVCEFLKQQGFKLISLNDHDEKHITHLTHNNHETFVDFIWLKSYNTQQKK